MAGKLIHNLKKLSFGILALLLIAICALTWWGWAPDLDPAELRALYRTKNSTFLEVTPGTTAHVRIEGPANAKAILLLHGSNASLHTWERWGSELSDQYKLISIDLPGHGLTGKTAADDYSHTGMARFALAVMNKLQIKQFVIAGSSMGGAVAMQTALMAPKRVQGLILIDPGGFRPPADMPLATDRPIAFKLAATPLARAIISFWTPRAIVEEGLRKSFLDQTLVTDTMIDRYYDLTRYPGNRRATAIRFAAYSSGKMFVDAANIMQPSLILWGEKDNLIQVEVGRHLSTAMPRATLKIYDNVGHLPHEELPTVSAADARTFLQMIGQNT